MSGETGAATLKSKWSDLYEKEDWWAIWLAVGIIAIALIFFFSGSTIKPIAVKPPVWEHAGSMRQHFAGSWPWYLAQFIMWLIIFTVSTKIMGFKIKEYVPGFAILYVVAALIFVVSSWKTMKDYNMEAPLVALLLGLIVGNVFRLPRWFGLRGIRFDRGRRSRKGGKGPSGH
jgi:uncharacterized membrane protein (DUF4010 family)